MHPSILLGGSGDPYASVQPLVRRRRAAPTPDISCLVSVTPFIRVSIYTVQQACNCKWGGKQRTARA